MRTLTPLEARVLGVLVEKQHTVPDTYPLSLNALVAGCNQKTARDPVIDATDAEVLTAVDGLKGLSLVFEGSGSRVVKFEHNLARVLGAAGAVGGAARGADAARAADRGRAARCNCERLHRFADISSVEGFLDELAGQGAGAGGQAAARGRRTRGALGAPAVRRGGARRAACVGQPTAAAGVSAGEIAALKAEQTRLAAGVGELRALVQRIWRANWASTRP